MNVYARLLNEIRPHWKWAAWGLGFSILMALAELLPTVLVKRLIDDALTQRSGHLLLVLSLQLLVLLAVRTVAHHTRMRCIGKLAQTVLFQIRTRLYEHLQKLSLSFYGNKRTGQIMSRVTTDVAVIERFVVEGLRDFLVNIIKLFVIAGIMLYYNFSLTLFALIPTIPLFWMTRYMSKHMRLSYRTMSRRMADMSSILSDTLSGIRVVQVFGQEDREAGKFRAKTGEFRDAGLRTNYLGSVFYPSINGAFGIGQVIVWLWGGHEVLSGRLSIGALVMFSTLAGQFYAPVQTLSQMSDLLASTSASGERVYEILDTQPEIRNVSTPKALPEVKGDLIFDHVSFGYNSEKPALQDVSLHVAPGETIGLVGPSGSGKSTLVSLISRFYDPSEGSVKVDGKDLRDLDLKDLRHHVSVVLQEPYLFHGTVRENVAYGKPDAPFEEIMNAARAANAHDFIMKMADGYDTHIGERGAKLSGGERQRMSIARAILDDPRILILDEATSAVDTESETLIQQALDNLMRDRTTLAIAHRLSTVKNADKLVVMEEGRIVEMGTHWELMDHPDGLYKRLVDMQTKLGATIGE